MLRIYAFSCLSGEEPHGFLPMRSPWLILEDERPHEITVVMLVMISMCKKGQSSLPGSGHIALDQKNCPDDSQNHE